MGSTDLPPPDADRQTRLEWVLHVEREARAHLAFHDGVQDRCSSQPYRPQAHTDHLPPAIWSGIAANQALFERIDWHKLYQDAYRKGWIHGGKGHILWLINVHFPAQAEGGQNSTVEDFRGYAWYPIEALSGTKMRCDGCWSSCDTGWCSNLPEGGVEIRCQRCALVISEKRREA